MSYLDRLQTTPLLMVSITLLLVATQIVVMVLNWLEKRRFGTVLLGTVITPLCTGFPNLMIGLFGQERLQGDLVLRLNIGNNLANTSLVTGVLILLAGPLHVRAATGQSAKARTANRQQALALFFLWLGTGLTLYLAHDGHITRSDGLYLTILYLVYQLLAIRGRGKVGKKQRLGGKGLAILFASLLAAAWVIQISVEGLSLAMSRAENLFPGWHLGLFLGLLTVVPESFLLLRLAWSKGSLGLIGLVGDCLVSIPLVIGLSAMFHPIETTPFESVSDLGLRPFLSLIITMSCLSLLSLREQPAGKRLGLLFLLVYASVWVFTTG